MVGAHQNYSSSAIVRRCLPDLTFSRLGTIPACDGQTDRETHGHMTTAYTTLA